MVVTTEGVRADKMGGRKGGWIIGGPSSWMRESEGDRHESHRRGKERERERERERNELSSRDIDSHPNLSGSVRTDA